ncbi:BQ5605_C036g11530 [Microbotryum silenes-dioicae]|uniref:BQ5605_C036g11530 protein n=1 Tax=Microbotryum silenes-dioicae TaxID=796604 RepID=A0A2X0PH75_9BASI|nr:BQ5605_C036g11530 [Microbotryum silenes-dioicae]
MTTTDLKEATVDCPSQGSLYDSMDEAGSPGGTIIEQASTNTLSPVALSVAVASASGVDLPATETATNPLPHHIHSEDGAKNGRALTESQDELASRKRKASGIVADESQKRGRRLFGLLQNTLKQAGTSKTSEAAKKRQQLEDKLYRKLHDERKHMMDQRDRSKEARDLVLAISLKEEELARWEATMQTQHEIELDLAEFLYAAPSKSNRPGPSDMVSFPNTAQLLSSQHIVSQDRQRPIFYLPFRLLKCQENELDDQVADVARRIKKAESEWLAHSRMEKGNIDEMKKKALRLQENVEEVKDQAEQTSQDQISAGQELIGSGDNEVQVNDVSRDRSPVVDALRPRVGSVERGEEEVEY